MKKILNIWLVLSVLIWGLSCWSGSSSEDKKADETANIFLMAAVDTLPNFEQAPTKSLPWSWGNVMYELFNILQDYDNATDEGEIGLDNIYKMLYQIGSFYQEAVRLAEPVDPQVINSPFDLLNDVTYDHAYNDAVSKHGYAIKDDGTTKNALLTWQNTYLPGNEWGFQPGNEYGILQGSVTDSTGAVDIDLICFCDYDSGNDYSLRVELTGNAIDHSFNLRTIKYNPNGYRFTAVGAGISQGADNEFLFKVSDNSSVTNKYYCFDAEAGETELQAMDAAGSATVPVDCSGYGTAVDALTLFDISNTTADVVLEPADLTQGAAVGSILLDFIE